MSETQTEQETLTSQGRCRDFRELNPVGIPTTGSIDLVDLRGKPELAASEA